MPSRRDVLKASLALPMSAVVPHRSRARGLRAVVVGAGAFGGWIALTLARRGADVTLIDAWGPGNARASSGGETRVIRTTYGSRAVYTEMAMRSLALWRAHDERWQRGFFRKTGALWMFGRDDSFGRASVATLGAAGVPVDELPPTEARRRFPQISFEGVTLTLHEPEAGYLFARRACEHVVERLVAEGGAYRQAAAASPLRIDGARLTRLALADGSTLEADQFVFACGPWLGALFPDVIGRRVTPTRQDVYYFGTPAGDDSFLESRLPVWIDFSGRVIYGIPGNANRGFKVADDTAGPRFDPTSGERKVTDAGVRAARTFLARRFPALKGAPLVGAEVCQYEASPDSHFIIDAHPRASNVWIAGGGSGHGFKMGPAVGEMVAALALGESQPDSRFGLARFAPKAGGATRRPREDEKWS